MNNEQKQIDSRDAEITMLRNALRGYVTAMGEALRILQEADNAAHAALSVGEPDND